MALLRADIVRRALGIAWPLVVGEAIDSLLSLVDVFFVSRLGEAAVAAVGLAGYASWVFFVSVQLFYMGSLVLVSQAYGGGRLDLASRASGESLTASLLLTVPVAAALIHASGWLVTVLAGPGAARSTLEMAASYLSVRALELPPLAAAMVLSAAFRAVGDTRPVLVATAASAAANAVLDPVLIFGLLGAPALGVVGAAVASVAASLVYLAVHWAYGSRLPFTLRPRAPGAVAARAARVGWPATVERLVFALGGFAYMGAIARCGEEAVAAHTVGLRIESIAYLPAFAVSVAATSLVGQAVGAGRMAEARTTAWEVVKLNTLLMAGAGAVLLALAPYAPTLFLEGEAARLATLYLVLAAVSEPALGAAMAAGSAVRGAGNTLAPMLVNVASLYLVRVAPSYALVALLPGGLCPLGPWLAMDADLAVRALVLAALVRRLERLARRVAEG